MCILGEGLMMIVVYAFMGMASLLAQLIRYLKTSPMNASLTWALSIDLTMTGVNAAVALGPSSNSSFSSMQPLTNVPAATVTKFKKSALSVQIMIDALSIMRNYVARARVSMSINILRGRLGRRWDFLSFMLASKTKFQSCLLPKRLQLLRNSVLTSMTRRDCMESYRHTLPNLFDWKDVVNNEMSSWLCWRLFCCFLCGTFILPPWASQMTEITMQHAEPFSWCCRDLEDWYRQRFVCISMCSRLVSLFREW